ncbi:EamA/RhaT family transporter [Oleiharenicola lentus]|uniref:EamA/RhaT family transporter n=1 Tax=Oleiharenicola lentus TaxID=2508720 RepID=UPI003F66BEAC
MQFNFGFFIPLACALTYVIGALLVKRASVLGAGVWRTNFVSNWALALVFVPLWFGMGGKFHALADYWQPAVTAVLFLGGQIFTFLALSRGDVSVTTPVLGTKVILVALMSNLLRAGEVPLLWWIGAALSTLAIALMHVGGDAAKRKNTGQTVLLAFLSAVAFSVSDVLLQKWVPAWGVGNYFPPMFLLVAVMSFAFMPFFSGSLRALSKDAWRLIGPAALLLALTNAGIVLAIVLVGSATAVNILYSLRGLLSVVLVWMVGHWFGNEEGKLSGTLLKLRMVGATLMLAAILLVLL